MICCTFFLVFSLTLWFPFSTRDTVAGETFAFFAISYMFIFPIFSSYWHFSFVTGFFAYTIAFQTYFVKYFQETFSIYFIDFIQKLISCMYKKRSTSPVKHKITCKTGFSLYCDVKNEPFIEFTSKNDSLYYYRLFICLFYDSCSAACTDSCCTSFDHSLCFFKITYSA